MISDKKLREVTDSFNQESVASVVQHTGREIYRGYKFRLRGDEKTPSASIRRKDGYIKDFGGDFSGDLIDFLRQHHGMSFQEAVEYIAICIGVEL